MTALTTLPSMRRLGNGPPLLFLHGMDGLLFCEPFLQALSTRFEVLAPEHPGWGRSPRQGHLRRMDDNAYTYLDLLDEIGTPVPVVGASIGAWIAAEAATKSCQLISSLALIAPVGTRTGTPSERRFLDLYASSADGVLAAMYGDSALAPDFKSLTDEQFEDLAQAQESTAFLAWEPYMHTPGLVERLHRITVPTLLVTGERDGFVLGDHVVAELTRRVSGPTQLSRLAHSGHRLEELAPTEVADLIAAFAQQAQ